MFGFFSNFLNKLVRAPKAHDSGLRPSYSTKNSYFYQCPFKPCIEPGVYSTVLGKFQNLKSLAYSCFPWSKTPGVQKFSILGRAKKTGPERDSNQRPICNSQGIIFLKKSLAYLDYPWTKTPVPKFRRDLYGGILRSTVTSKHFLT